MHQVSIVLTDEQFRRIKLILDSRRREDPVTSRGDVIRELLDDALKRVKS
jgi:hypothetical protein